MTDVGVSAHMKSMTYFTTPSDVAFALLFAGLAVSIASLIATVNTTAFRPGSPATVQDRVSHRIGGYVGAALLVVGAAPILFAPIQALLQAAGF